MVAGGCGRARASRAAFPFRIDVEVFHWHERGLRAHRCLARDKLQRHGLVERRDALQDFLKQRDIGSAVYYPLPLHLQPCFAYLAYQPGRLPVTEAAASQVLSLPVYPELSRAQLDWVVESIRAFYG